MSLFGTQLSSLSASVDDLAKRVAEMASTLEADGEADAVAALYEAERSLQMAQRSLDRARRAL